MKIVQNAVGEFSIVKVSGNVDRHSSGLLYDTLSEIAGGGATRLIVDLSDVSHLTRAGSRGLIVAARLMQTRGGEMRICGASLAILGILQGFGFDHLFKCDPSPSASFLALTPQAAGTGHALPPRDFRHSAVHRFRQYRGDQHRVRQARAQLAGLSFAR